MKGISDRGLAEMIQQRVLSGREECVDVTRTFRITALGTKYAGPASGISLDRLDDLQQRDLVLARARAGIPRHRPRDASTSPAWTKVLHDLREKPRGMPMVRAMTGAGSWPPLPSRARQMAGPDRVVGSACQLESHAAA